MSERQAEYITGKEDMQMGRAFTAAGWKIADQIDREMVTPDGIERLERAADLMALLDYAQTGAVELRIVRGEVRVAVVDMCDPEHFRVYEGEGDKVIAAAASWCQRIAPPNRGLFVADADAPDADATSISAAAASLPRADKPGGGE
jgi:hypothetical protein